MYWLCVCLFVRVLSDTTSTIAWLTHIKAGTTAILVVNRFDVRYHIIYVASTKQCNCTASKTATSHTWSKHTGWTANCDINQYIKLWAWYFEIISKWFMRFQHQAAHLERDTRRNTHSDLTNLHWLKCLYSFALQLHWEICYGIYEVFSVYDYTLN